MMRGGAKGLMMEDQVLASDGVGVGLSTSVFVSPDGKRVVYTKSDGAGGPTLWYVDETKKPREVMSLKAFAPQICVWVSPEDLRPPTRPVGAGMEKIVPGPWPPAK